jgi:hypothetical protein
VRITKLALILYRSYATRSLSVDIRWQFFIYSNITIQSPSMTMNQKQEKSNNSNNKRRLDAVNERGHNKKPRFMWSNELHDQFVGAIFDIGASHTTATADFLRVAAAESGRAVSSTTIDMFLDRLELYKSQNPVAIKTKKVLYTKKARMAQPARLPSVLPTLSAEMLRPYTTSAAFVRKEFPHLKDLPIQKANDDVILAEQSPTDICRPFSPISLDIGTFNFDWNKDDFDSSIIRMFTDAVETICA